MIKLTIKSATQCELPDGFYHDYGKVKEQLAEMIFTHFDVVSFRDADNVVVNINHSEHFEYKFGIEVSIDFRLPGKTVKDFTIIELRTKVQRTMDKLIGEIEDSQSKGMVVNISNIEYHVED